MSKAITEADLLRAFKQIRDEPVGHPVVTVHHPKCQALATGDRFQCNCGGSAFPR